MAVNTVNVSVNGTNVHCESAGDSRNDKVLLLHGWGCDLSLLRPLSEALSSHYYVLAVDFPGHGKSGRPPEPWGVPDYAECISQLLRKLEFYPCAVIAHSFGCRITTVLATSEPALFTKIILTGAAGIKPAMTEEAKKKQQRYHRLKKVYETIDKTGIFGALPGHLLSGITKKYGSSDYAALDPELRKTFVRVVNQDLTEYYPRISQSVLLIWGENDTATPLWMGKKMEQLIPDAGLVVFENADHYAFLEQLPRFLVIVNSFLEQER